MIIVTLGSALAGDGAVLGWLYMPVTPSDPRRDAYHTLVKAKEAEGKDWASDTPGFSCEGAGDHVQVWVRRGSWPTVLPKKVTCTHDSSKAVAKIRIRDERLEPMFVGDGTLVMPRLPQETAHYEGKGPRADLVVGQGKTEGIGAFCKTKPEGFLDITVAGELEDGTGRCLFRTPLGETIPVKFLVRTVKP